MRFNPAKETIIIRFYRVRTQCKVPPRILLNSTESVDDAKSLGESALSRLQASN